MKVVKMRESQFSFRQPEMRFDSNLSHPITVVIIIILLKMIAVIILSEIAGCSSANATHSIPPYNTLLVLSTYSHLNIISSQSFPLWFRHVIGTSRRYLVIMAYIIRFYSEKWLKASVFRLYSLQIHFFSFIRIWWRHFFKKSGERKLSTWCSPNMMIRSRL